MMTVDDGVDRTALTAGNGVLGRVNYCPTLTPALHTM